jgi:CD109 antigen
MTLPKQYSVFIQTDKPKYKPGDKVNFRVLVIDSETKPFDYDNMKVELYDGDNNFVQNFDNGEISSTDSGVYKNDFNIVEEPVMGRWELRVVINDEEKFMTKKSFTIEEYVLPRFEVIVDTKRDVMQSEKSIKLAVYALYTFGEPVKGKFKISASVYDTAYPTIVQHTNEKLYNVEVKQTAEFNIFNDLAIVNSIRPHEVVFDVEFEELLTGQKLKPQREIRVRIHKTGTFKIEVQREKKNFKPGFPFKFKAIVKKFDGTVISTAAEPLSVDVNYFLKTPKCSFVTKENEISRKEVKKAIRIKTITEIELDIPSNTTALVITLKYFDAKYTMNVTRYEAKSREYLVVRSLTEK